jgi:hypothetical protein
VYCNDVPQCEALFWLSSIWPRLKIDWVWLSAFGPIASFHSEFCLANKCHVKSSNDRKIIKNAMFHITGQFHLVISDLPTVLHSTNEVSDFL